MVKFLIGLVVGIILTGLMLLIVFFALLRFREKPPAIAENSTLVLELDGEVPERAPVEFPIPFLEQRSPLTVENVWSLLRKAAVDSRVKAVVIQPRGLQIGWAKAQEIRSDLEQFKKSGKPLYAYLRGPGTREYYIATAADRIILAPQDLLNLKGLRMELMFFRNTLDKVGVNVEIEHAGKYKDFGDVFTRTSMSPETREVYTSIIDELYGELVSKIAGGRHKSPEEIKRLIDQGPYISANAVMAGLVDEVRFEDEMYGELKKAIKSDSINKLSPRNYVKISPGSLGLEGKSRVALLTGDGGISRGEEEQDSFSGDSGIKSVAFNKLLRSVGDDASIKGVVVRIDSPGGEVSASDEIWREMNLLSKKKPLVISMSDAAASGGYYISLTGDPILAYPATLTGSIGVVYGKPNLHGLYDKLGITKDFILRGQFADLDSDYKPLSDAGRAKLREGIDASYTDFVAKVAQSRRRKYDEIEPLAQGRVWLGSQARQRGLVDELGGLDRAVELIKRKAGIPAGEKVTIVTYPPRRSIFDVMFNRPGEGSVDAKLRALLKGWSPEVWLRGGMLRIMPVRIAVN
jgi:protease IV